VFCDIFFEEAVGQLRWDIFPFNTTVCVWCNWYLQCF